ncbi:uncharacterized protein BKCO1_6400049 [Diplodia corticola]|uniref:Uncharacterized protein n=1 Tax=Diplodia corticola TaxID=236234 RepID=A0A1J9RQL6_9PEZI|nr:uncharacterized protein BKCO1_6400049 [Diplodia corticola]OJD30196.1 hypothetical protein BKCO1_6400049 [Diplodia corticola]
MPPKKGKRGAPWAAINARKQQLEQAKARIQQQALNTAADAARTGVPVTALESQQAAMPPPQNSSDWSSGPASGTRANRRGVHLFATNLGAMYGVGEDQKSAQADMMEKHEQLQAEAAAATLQKLSRDDSYNNPPPEIAAAMDRQRKRQGGIFTPISFLPSASQDAQGMTHPGSPYIPSSPPVAPNIGSSYFARPAASGQLTSGGGSYVSSAPVPMSSEYHAQPSGKAPEAAGQPGLKRLTPPTDDEPKAEPSTPKARYYTNPHHGPSRYGGWFAHVRRLSQDLGPSTPQRVLEPPRQTVWPQRSQPSSSSEPLLTPSKKPKVAEEDEEDNGSECASLLMSLSSGPSPTAPAQFF